MKKTLLILAALTLAQVAFSQGTIVFNNRGGGTTSTASTAAPGTVLAPIYNADPADPTHRISGNTVNGRPGGNTSYGAALRLDGGGTGNPSGGNWTAQLWAVAGSSALSADAAAAAGSPFAPLRNSANADRATFRTTFLTDDMHGTINQPSQPMIVDGVTANGPNTVTFQMRVWDTKGGTINTWADVLANPGVFRGYSDLFQNAFSLGGTEVPPNTPPFMQGLTSFNVFIVPEPSVIALGVLGAGCLFLLRRRK